MKFSANLGFLWKDLPLPDAIRAAKAAGFDAVECHWPYDVPEADVIAALSETGLPMLGINTVRGNVEAGDNGLLALPGRAAEARAAIDQAVSYAAAIGAGAIHAMAGFADGATAQACFIANITYACDQAAAHDITILIEPLNQYDAPGYFLKNTAHAVEIISEVGKSNLKLMFDFYHVQLIEGDITNRLTRLLPHIGHIQFAAAPGRGAPGQGEIAFEPLFRHVASLGYDRPLGAEYKTNGPTEDTLGWLQSAKAIT
ncbi:MAG: TIM barrel protein [Paracoccaceae bacterium]